MDQSALRSPRDSRGRRSPTWTAPDGWPLRRLDWPRGEGATARGQPAFAGRARRFLEKYLEAFDHWHGAAGTITAFDWRGQGGSRGDVDGRPCRQFRSVWSTISPALFADWRAATPGPHVAIGHSMGGHLLLRALAERDRRSTRRCWSRRCSRSTARLPAWAAALDGQAMSASASPASGLACDRRAGAGGSLRQSILTLAPNAMRTSSGGGSASPATISARRAGAGSRAAYASCGRLTPERLRAIDDPGAAVGTDRDRLVSPAAIRAAAAAPATPSC